jgi:hypothetical protein
MQFSDVFGSTISTNSYSEYYFSDITLEIRTVAMFIIFNI